MNSAVGVELGPHTVRVVAISDSGTPVVLTRADQRSSNGDLAPAARSLVDAVVRKAGGGRLRAGVCAYDASDGAIRATVAALGDAVAIQGGVIRTGAAAVAAETWMGAAKEARNVVALVIGDHVSAGIVMDGQAWNGAHDMAGSAAWLALNPVERQDYRRTGCLDAEVSSRGIARRLVWRIQAGDHSNVLDKAGELDAITAEHVYEGARARDGVAVSVVRDTAKYIGMAVANFVATLDPDLVVLCGEVTGAGDLLLEPVRQECARRLPAGLVDLYRLEISPLGEDAAAIGAARLALP